MQPAQIRRRQPGAGVAMGILITFALGVGLSAARADELTHEQKVKAARRLVTTPLYQYHYGDDFKPAQYAGWADAEVEKAYADSEREFTASSNEYQKAHKALTDYQNELARSHKSATDDQLASLETKAAGAHRRLVDATITWNCLELEHTIRTDPDHVIEVERSLQDTALASEHFARRIEEQVRQIEQQRQQGQPAPPPPGPGAPKPEPSHTKTSPAADLVFGLGTEKPPHDTLLVLTPEAAAESRPASGRSLEISTAQFYGPSVDPTDIAALEANQIQRLPEELKRGVPREVQRLFFYGDYENLPREAKEHLKHLVRELKASGKIADADLEREFLRAFRSVESVVPPERLSNQTPAGAAESAAWLLMEFTQYITDLTYDKVRRDKWQEAYMNVAAEIPLGKKEPVVFMEDMERHQCDLITWMECKSVKAYRGEFDVKTSPLQPFEALADVRKSEVAPYWRFYQVNKLDVTGTGQGRLRPPSVQEAHQAGFEMGKLAVSLKLTKDVMDHTYQKYNQDPQTREAFKKGYREGSQGRGGPLQP
jgi:hypothetical protein